MLKPRSTAEIRAKLRIISPAPATSTTASATSAAMRIWPPRFESDAPTWRLLRASAEPSVTRDSRIAGARPKSSVVGTSSAAVSASTLRFSVTGEFDGSESGMLATSASSDEPGEQHAERRRGHREHRRSR